MDIAIIAVLLIAAVILFLVELFVIPGISIAGILAGGCYLFANYYAFANIGTGAGIATLVVTVGGGTGAIVWFMRSKTLDRMALKENLTGNVSRPPHAIRPGDKGITTTRLALIGYANIGGHVVEVKSTGELLNERTPIVVVRSDNGSLLVERDKTPQAQ